MTKLARVTDPLAMIEAAYDTKPDFESWARGVLESSVPDLDAGLGVVAMTIRISEPGSIFEFGAGALSEARLQTVRGMTRTIEPTEHALLFRPGVVGTVSELLPAFTADPPSTPEFAEKKRIFWDPFGVKDAIGLVAQADADRLFVITAPLPHLVKLTPERRRRLERCAAHIGTALRLRRSPLVERAIVRPDGVIAHAEGRAKEKPALEALRRRAIEIDRARSHLRHRDPETALLLWKGLLDGEWSLIERFERDGRRYYVACENAPDGRGPRSLTKRERQVVELAARGHTNKLAAYTLGLAEASTSLHLTRALKKLGVRTRAELAIIVGAVKGT
jgi:DNA-binding CsgD family transcriptional regulator